MRCVYEPSRLTVSADELADLLGVTRKTVGRYQTEGIISRLPGGQAARYDCRAAVRGVAEHLRKGAALHSENKSAKEISLIEGGLLKAKPGRQIFFLARPFKNSG